MVDTKNPGDKTLSVPTKTLTLKPRVETGTVRQSFSHGRTKQVVVEKRGKRRIGGDGPVTEPAAAPAPVVAKAPVAKAPLARPAAPAAPRSNSGVVLRTLTEDERSARASALAEANVRAEEERRLAEAEAARRNSKEGREQAEREAAEARRKAEEERHRLEEEAKRKAELEAKRRFGEAEAKAAAPATTTRAAPPARPAAVAADGSDEDEGPRQIRRGPGGVARPVIAPKPTAKPAPAKQRGRLTLVTALNADDVRERSIASFRRRTQRLKGHASNEPKEKLIREVIIPEAITIQELANRMAERAVDVIRMLMKQGQMVKITDVIDADTAQLIAEELGHTVKRVAASDVEEGLFDSVDDFDRHRTAFARRHRDGSRRPRQDLAARCAAPRQRGVWRSRRYHPAYRRLSSHLAGERKEDHLHRYAGPRCVHSDARARCQGHRYRHSRGCCR